MSDPILTPEQYAALTAQALAAPPPTPEQRRRLRPLLAGTIPSDPDRAERVRRVVDQAPPWTPEQRRILRGLLAGSIPGLDERLVQRAREEAAKAGPFPPKVVAEVAPLMGWTVAGAPAVSPMAPPTPVVVQPSAPRPMRHYLDRYWDACGCLLYVGITADFRTRDRAHERSSPWHDLATRHETEELPSEAAAREAESRAIRTEHPAFNAAGRKRATQTALLLAYAREHAGGQP